jgi:hypothetical protein
MTSSGFWDDRASAMKDSVDDDHPAFGRRVADKSPAAFDFGKVHIMRSVAALTRTLSVLDSWDTSVENCDSAGRFEPR